MALTWNDIDFNNNTIEVCKTLEYFNIIDEKCYEKEIHKPKTLAGIRVIPLLSDVAIILEKLSNN